MERVRIQLNIRIYPELGEAIVKHPAFMGEHDTIGRWAKRLIEAEISTHYFGENYPSHLLKGKLHTILLE